jgi:hypothetical protein
MKIITALAVCLAMPAFAEDNKCGAYPEMAAELVNKYGEAMRFVGLDSNGLVTVLFFNPETSSWTALIVEPSGRACMVAAGMNGELLPAPPEGDPA